MSKERQKINPHQQFYAKRLNTESFSSPSLKDSLSNLASKMEQQIQVVKRKLRVKNLKMFRAREKIKNIEHQEALMRDTLRQQIDRKIKNSQSNLEKLMLEKSSLSKSKSKFRETTLSRIKMKEDSLNQESFRRSQMYSRQSEKYLDIKHLQRTTSKATSCTQSPKKTYYPSSATSDAQICSLVEPRKKASPNVLKVPEQCIRQKQAKKASLEQSRESKNLYEYIQKLNIIQTKRYSREDRLKQSLKKSIDSQQAQKRKASQLLTIKPNNRRESADPTKSVIQNRVSFSELYSRKLEEKLARKSLYQEISLRQGDRIIQEQSATKQSKRNNILLKETLKEVQMRANFRYRQMRLH